MVESCAEGPQGLTGGVWRIAEGFGGLQRVAEGWRGQKQL